MEVTPDVSALDTLSEYAAPAIVDLGPIHLQTAGDPVDDGSGNLSCPPPSRLVGDPPNQTCAFAI